MGKLIKKESRLMATWGWGCKGAELGKMESDC